MQPFSRRLKYWASVYDVERNLIVRSVQYCDTRKYTRLEGHHDNTHMHQTNLGRNTVSRFFSFENIVVGEWFTGDSDSIFHYVSEPHVTHNT